jgi:hypothetical protein
MAIVRYVYTGDGRTCLFAIVADDTHAQYIWRDPEEAWFDDDRVLDFLGEQPAPTDATGWADVASLHLGNVVFGDEEVPGEDALTYAQTELLERPQPGLSPYPSSRAANAYDQVSRDYPRLGEDDVEGGDADPRATLQWALMTLGPIDPNGPNAWILRAADGNPQPGDEAEFIHWDAPVYAGAIPAPETETEMEAPSEQQ